MNKQWWHNTITYQIYPKSFCDSNGDGVGDLRGVISKLDYIKDLGIDNIWLSPIYCSPLADQGYDISDYYNIDPVFGTMDDFDELVAESKKRGMNIVMDLVVNHCSDEHEWFRKACEDPDGPYGQYFYIRDWHEGEPLPCNWRSYFGGPCWDLLPGHTDKIYFHAFHKKQPDLNWENPACRQDIFKMINWWLEEKGIAGFRIDAIINIKKVLPFRDYPADREDGLCSITRMLEDAKGIGDFFQEMADTCFHPHEAFTVGEVFNEKAEDLPFIIGENGYFSSMFDFAETVINQTEKGWYSMAPVTAEQYKDACFYSQNRVEGIGFLSNIIENHDEPRGVCRYIPDGDTNDMSKKMLATLNVLMKGLPFIYQGQEIGMENVDFHDISEVDDVSSLDEYKVALEAGLTPAEAIKVVANYSRDNGRTPFHWSDEPQAGFTSGTPWLRINPNYTRINAASQVCVEGSIFSWYKNLLALRKSPEYADTFVYGTSIPYKRKQKNVMGYFRRGERNILVLANYQREPQEIELPSEVKKVLLNNSDRFAVNDNVISMEGYQVVVVEF